jgi:hypothetical protein
MKRGRVRGSPGPTPPPEPSCVVDFAPDRWVDYPYLRCASYLLGAKKVLRRTADEREQAYGQNPASEAICASWQMRRQPMEVTCKQGGRHRWDEADARCLDCGRTAEECADELHERLVEKENLIDHMGDQIEALRTLLEEAAEALDTAGLLDTRDQILAALAELEASDEP